MDAKSKANFIHAVAAGQTVVCPKCNASNEPDTVFCAYCGTRIVSPVENTAPVFDKIEELPAVKKIEEEPEPMSAFAQGLPEWSVEPPQVLVRRR